MRRPARLAALPVRTPPRRANAVDGQKERPRRLGERRFIWSWMYRCGRRIALRVGLRLAPFLQPPAHAFSLLDLSTMHSLRDRTLRTLHNVIDDLKIRAGVRTTYRLLSTAQGGAWGCIRVAPLASRSSSSSSAAGRAGTSATRSATNGRPAVASRNTLDSVEKSSSGVGAVPQGFPRTLAVNRRTTLAAVDKGRPVGRLATGESNLVADAQAALDDDKNKRETGERVRDAVDKDARGNIDEGRYYVLAVGGQPALVIT